MAITAAGYIIADNEAVHGYGPTVDAAWENTERWMSDNGVRLLDDDEDSELGNWTRRSNLRAWPATADLIRAIEQHGGAIRWDRVGGVACTEEESSGAGCE